jgi:predicted nucleic acid-binding protein
MPKNDIFLDSGALLAGIISSQGAARALLLLGEDDKLILTVSEQVIVEIERNLARKAMKTLPFAREMILRANIRILPNPPVAEVRQHLDWISHPADVPILVAASHARVDFMCTLNTRHFIDDPAVAIKSGLRIGTPGDALAWVREQLAKME